MKTKNKSKAVYSSALGIFLLSVVYSEGSKVLDMGAAAMAALEWKQDIVAGNIASMTPGYKRTVVALESDEEGRPYIITKKDLSQGPIRKTGNRADIAIIGNSGFFSLDGGRVFTRDGQFRWNSENTLVSKDDLPVDGESGSITKDPSLGPVSIDSRGNVQQGGERINGILVYEVEEDAVFIPAEGGYIVADGATTQLEEVALAPESLESSNVSNVEAMVELMKVSNAYKANSTLISTMDARYANAIRHCNMR